MVSRNIFWRLRKVKQYKLRGIGLIGYNQYNKLSQIERYRCSHKRNYTDSELETLKDGMTSELPIIPVLKPDGTTEYAEMRRLGIIYNGMNMGIMHGKDRYSMMVFISRNICKAVRD